MLFKRKYLFTSNSRSDKGIMSTVCSMISFVSFSAALYSVLKAGGCSSDRLGAVGFMACLFALAGLILGVISLAERDTFRFFPRFGFFMSLISIIAWGAVVYAGFK